MSSFCTNCGQPNEDSLKYCKHCGEKIADSKADVSKETVDSPIKTKKQFTKKQKILSGAIAAVVVLLAAIYMWGNTYYSQEKTAERFMAALIEEEVKAVQQLTSLDGNEISEAESRALITLAKEETTAIYLENLTSEEFIIQNDLFASVEDGKAFFIFSKYTFALVPQYAELYVPFEDIEVTFNEESFPITDEDGEFVVFGPIAPGKYDLHSSYTDEATELESEDTIVLANSYGDIVFHELSLEAAFVTVEIDNANNSVIENAFIEIDEEKIAFDEDLTIEQIGPLQLDGSVTLTPVVETSWGEVRLEPIEVSEASYEISLDAINEDLMESLSDTILKFGEELVQARAAKDSSPFTTITADLTDKYNDEFSEKGTFFTGQLEKLEIDYTKLAFTSENELTVPVESYMNGALFSDGDDADLEEIIEGFVLDMVYDADEEKWFITEEDTRKSSSDFEATVTLESSQELVESSAPSAKASESSSSSNSNSDAAVERVTLNYIYFLVEAINAGNYSRVQPYIKNGSALHSMQEDLVARLSKDGMTQEVQSARVENIVEVNGGWKVETAERVKLIYASGAEETKSYAWTYTVEEDGNGVALTNIE